MQCVLFKKRKNPGMSMEAIPPQRRAQGGQYLDFNLWAPKQ
jgi:hypothetical protein